MTKLVRICLIASLGFICLSADATWQCTVVNRVKNQTWFGTGNFRAQAMENAMKFCTNNSALVKHCLPVRCIQQ